MAQSCFSRPDGNRILSRYNIAWPGSLRSTRTYTYRLLLVNDECVYIVSLGKSKVIVARKEGGSELLSWEAGKVLSLHVPSPACHKVGRSARCLRKRRFSSVRLLSPSSFCSGSAVSFRSVCCFSCRPASISILCILCSFQLRTYLRLFSLKTVFCRPALAVASMPALSRIVSSPPLRHVLRMCVYTTDGTYATGKLYNSSVCMRKCREYNRQSLF